MLVAALGATWLLTLLGLALLVFASFWEWSFTLEEAAAYLLIGGVLYGSVWAIGRSLNERCDAVVTGFVDGRAAGLSVGAETQRVAYGLLLLLLPLYLYYALLALYLSLSVVASVFWLLNTMMLFARGSGYLGLFGAVVAAGLLLGALVSAGATLAGLYVLLVPPRHNPKGIAVTPGEQPRLWALAREVADAVRQRAPDRIVLTPQPGIAVYLDAGLFAALSGRGRRVLLIGVPSVHGLTVDDFRAILAHEYGHFGHADTQWALFANAVGGALWKTVDVMPKPVQYQDQRNLFLALARGYNLGFWILFLYQALYLRVTAGFSRLGEVQADVQAMTLYGGPTFERALTQVVANDCIFHNVVELGIVPDLLAQGKQVADLARLMQIVDEDMSAADREYWHTPSLATGERRDPHDTHPLASLRVAYARRYPPRGGGDDRLVESLVADWPSLNASLAEVYNRALPSYA